MCFDGIYFKTESWKNLALEGVSGAAVKARLRQEWGSSAGSVTGLSHLYSLK